MHLDPEIAALFRSEAEDHLRALEEGCLALESGRSAHIDMDELFRAAHSLKGAARVLGLEPLEAGAHALEDLLDGLRSKREPIPTGRPDDLHRALAPLRVLVESALSGGPEPIFVPTEAAGPTEEAPAPVLREPQHSQGTEMLRVPVARLDALLTHAGELLVLQQRLQRRVEAAQDLVEHLSGPLGREGMALVQGLREDAGRLEGLFGALDSTIHRTRLVPLSALLEQCPRWARDLEKETGKLLSVETSGGELEVDKRLVDGLRDPLLHLLRNAVDHGLEPPEERRKLGKPERGSIHIKASRISDGLSLAIADDGQGIDPHHVRRAAVASGRIEASKADTLDDAATLALIFEPGFSTRGTVSKLSGRGVGLDLVRAQVESLRGRVDLKSEPGRGTRFELQIPLNVAAMRALLVRAGGLRLALPSASVRACLRLRPEARFSREGREAFLYEGQPLLLQNLAQLLGRSGTLGSGDLTLVIIDTGTARMGLVVEEIIAEQEVVQKPLHRRVRALESLTGMALLGDGGLSFIPHLSFLERAARSAAPLKAAPPVQPKGRPRVLLAEDSLTTRIQLKRILQAEGFDVTLAVDGLDAWTKLTSGDRFQALVSDVEMPGLDGYSLTERVKNRRDQPPLPVVLLTSLARPEDLERGLEAGASAYLTKGAFDQTELVETLRRLV